MIKRFRWVFLTVLVGGAILWLGLARDGEKVESTKAQPGEKKMRESSRHQTGEVEKNTATPFEKKIAEQERKVEELKKKSIALAKAKAQIFLSSDAVPQTEGSPEGVAKKAQAAQDFEETRREYIANRQLLENMKLELAEEQKNAKPLLVPSR